MSKKETIPLYTIFVCSIAAIGGLLFGYNTSVISGAVLFLSEEFNLGIFQEQLIVSTTLIGALIGAFIAGPIADHFGRKKGMFFSIFLFLVGIYLLTFAHSVLELLIGRFVIGLGIGFTSLVVPLYIAEMSPAFARGMLVSLNQFAITFGILLAYVLNYLFSSQAQWRWMFGASFVFAFLQLIGLFFISDTPGFFISHGKTSKAKAILKKTRSPRKDEEIYVEANISRKEASWKHLFDPKVRGAFIVGLGISVFQQITGINTVIYYAPRIFQLAGFASAKAAISATMSVGIINVAMTIIALYLIDRLGRRPLLIVGLIGMILSLSFLGWSFYASSARLGVISILSLMSYVAFFAISLGPVAWLIIAEIFPLKIRGRAMGVAVFANWTSNYLVSLTFLTLIEYLGTSATFWFYSLICLLALWFVIKRVPETKGKSLEQIQKFWH